MTPRRSVDEHTIAMIKAVPILSGCTPRELKGIASTGKEVHF